MFVYSDFDWSRSLTKIILIKFIVDSVKVIWHTFNVIFRLALIIEEWIYLVFAFSKHNLKIPQQYCLTPIKRYKGWIVVCEGRGGEQGRLSINRYVVEKQELSHKRVWFSFPLQMRRFFITQPHWDTKNYKHIAWLMWKGWNHTSSVIAVNLKRCQRFYCVGVLIAFVLTTFE